MLIGREPSYCRHLEMHVIGSDIFHFSVLIDIRVTKFRTMELLNIQNKIYEIRGVKVMVDYDLANLYDVETKVLNQAVKRNIKRFPEDFMFQLSQNEWDTLRSQIVTSNRRGGTRYLPFAFTEQGVAMLSGVLKSDRAIDANIIIMRTFVLIRKFSLTNDELSRKLREIERKYNKNFKDIYQALNYLLQKEKVEIEHKNRKKIGF